MMPIYVRKKPLSFLLYLPLYAYIFVLFHLRMALVGAETCSVLVLVIMFTYNKHPVTDRSYFMFNWLTNTMESRL